jgi:hypothetical protein
MLLKGLIVYSITLLLRGTNDRSLHYVLLKHVVTSWSSVLSKHDVHIYVPYVRHVYLISFESEKLAHISLPPEFPRGGHIAILVSSLSRICQLFHLDTKLRTHFFPFDLPKTYTMHTHRLRFKSIFFLFIFHYTPHSEVCPSVCWQNPMSYDNLSCVSYNLLKFYQLFTGEVRMIPFIFDDFHFCRSRVIGLDMTENRMFTLCRMITWVVFLRMFW